MFSDRDNYEILSREQLDEGGCNDNPDTVLQVRHLETGKVGWVAGPHGVSYCALGDWLASGDEPAETREAAIATGCED